MLCTIQHRDITTANNPTERRTNRKPSISHMGSFSDSSSSNASLTHDGVPLEQALPECAICLEDIEPCTPGQDDTTLYCNNLPTTNNLADDGVITPDGTQAPIAVAHGGCIKQLYQSWLHSPADMRLPHCPRCTTVLSAAVTLKQLSLPEMLERYATIQDSRLRQQQAEKLNHLGEAILSCLRDPAQGAIPFPIQNAIQDNGHNPLQRIQVLNLYLLLVVATHAKTEDDAVFHRLSQRISRLPQQEIIKLLSFYAAKIALDTPVDHMIEIALGEALRASIPGRNTKDVAYDVILGLTEHARTRSSQNRISSAIPNALCQTLSLTQLVQMLEELDRASQEILREYVPHPSYPAAQMPAEFYQYNRAFDLLLAGFENKLTRPNAPASPRTIAQLNRLRKHYNMDIRYASRRVWSVLAQRAPTDKICFDTLINKLSSHKGLSAKDMRLLEQSIQQVETSTQRSLAESEPFAQAVLAYPREGKGLRPRDMVFHPFKNFHNRIRIHEAQDSISSMLSDFSTQEHFSESQIKALSYLAHCAPKTVQEQANALLHDFR